MWNNQQIYEFLVYKWKPFELKTIRTAGQWWLQFGQTIQRLGRWASRRVGTVSAVIYHQLQCSTGGDLALEPSIHSQRRSELCFLRRSKFLYSEIRKTSVEDRLVSNQWLLSRKWAKLPIPIGDGANFKLNWAISNFDFQLASCNSFNLKVSK